MVPIERQFFSFVGMLVLIAVILYGMTIGLEVSPDVRYGSKKHVDGLGLVYTMVFAIASGVLNYLGFSYLENFLLLHVSDRSLATTMSASIVIFFCFMYSSQLKRMLELFFSVKSIPHGLESSLSGYVIGRILLFAFLWTGVLKT